MSNSRHPDSHAWVRLPSKKRRLDLLNPSPYYRQWYRSRFRKLIERLPQPGARARFTLAKQTVYNLDRRGISWQPENHARLCLPGTSRLAAPPKL